jgi:hypothetical protein
VIDAEDAGGHELASRPWRRSAAPGGGGQRAGLGECERTTREPQFAQVPGVIVIVTEMASL